LTLTKVKKKIPISIDTRKSEIMEKAVKEGVKLINDISGLSYDKQSIKVLKKSKIPFVINHIKGLPKTMQKNPKYKNVLFDIYDFFEEKIKLIRNNKIQHNNILLDPGIGFGKNLKHNMNLISNISIFHSLGFPILIGMSRKKFIKDISGINDSKYRVGGTISSSLFAMTQGVQVLRVHNVNEVIQGIKVFKSLTKKND
ncbi:dihydropteroate synthase, partial [Candidatus Pelagibacter sp.]|nr:dihydropteroate synthase [Candidatus Pelagibacter sp.]